MKFISKRNKEPEELSTYRETPGVTYDGIGKEIKDIIKKSLLEEQGYICAYCMGKIKCDTCTIEHYISQKRHETSPYSEEEHKRNSLLYINMSGVCVNDSVHCDKHRGNVPLEILNPHHSTCEELITYNLGGNIVPKGHEQEKVTKDIETLGLDCEKLKKQRSATWDDVWKRFKQEHEKKDWSKELFLEYANLYRNKKNTRKGLRYHAYCNFIAWCFEHYALNFKKL